MKIAIISSWEIYCGIARYTYNLANALSFQKQNVKIFGKYKEKEEKYIQKQSKQRLSFSSVRCWTNKLKDSPQKLFDELLKFQPDIIHIQDIFRRQDIIKKLQQLFPGKIVVTFHSISSPKMTFHGTKKTSSDDIFLKEAQNHINHLIVHNSLSKKDIMRKLKINEKKITVIHHGSFLLKKISKRKARKNLNIPQNINLILSYGFFTPRKGIIELSETIPSIAKKIPDIHYIHIGRKRLSGKDYYGKTFQQLKDKIKKFAMQNKIKFIWKYLSEKEITLYLQAADIIILFYQEEKPLLHASGIAHDVIGAGSPIIATDVTTFCEFPKSSMYKIPFDKKMLEKAVIKIIKNKNLQNKLIKNALAYAKTSSWKNTAIKHLKIYQKLIN